MASNVVDITGLNVEDLVFRLWENAPFLPHEEGRRPRYDARTLRAILQTDPEKYVNRLCGKTIQTSFRYKYVNTWGYDRVVGQGTFAQIVREMRNKE